MRAGQWARALCINESLKSGAIFEYLKKIYELGWGVIVFNPNLNAAPVEEKKPKLEEMVK